MLLQDITGELKSPLYVRYYPFFVFILAYRKISKSIWRTTVYRKKGRVGSAEHQQEKKKTKEKKNLRACMRTMTLAMAEKAYRACGVCGCRMTVTWSWTRDRNTLSITSP